MPSSPVILDDGLSSLEWLQGLPTLNATVPEPPLLGPGSGAPSSPLSGDLASMGAPGRPPAAAYARLSLPRIVAHGHCPHDVDYQTNATIKPPYSYDTLICMAMEDSKENKITLSSIYKYIADNFCYYRHADPTWQKSIRHNLSVNKCFVKVPRQKGERGKGGFWTTDPQYAERLLSGGYNNRQMPRVQINPALQKRLQVNLPPPSRTPCSPTGTQTSLCLNADSRHLLMEFEEAMGAGQTWDPDMEQGTMPESWPMVQGQRGLKRKETQITANNAKVFRRSSSPLQSVDEPELQPLMGGFYWDALLDSAINRELGLEGGEPLTSPIEAGTLDLTFFDAQTDNEMPDFDEETFLAMALPEGF